MAERSPAARALAGLAMVAALLLVPQQVQARPAAPPAPKPQVASEVGRVAFDSIELLWTGTGQKGYAPLAIELRNLSGEERNVDLRATCEPWNSGHVELLASVQLAPREERRLELALPLFMRTLNTGNSRSRLNPMLRIEVAGRAEEVPLLSRGFSTWAHRSIVIFSDRGRGELLALELSHALKTGLITVKQSVAVGAKLIEHPNTEVALRSLDELCSRIDVYTSLDAVLVDLRDKQPEQEKLAVLLDWVRVGGRAIFIDDRSVEGGLGRLPVFEGAFEERLLFNPRNVEHGYRCGHGVLFHHQVDGAEGEGQPLDLPLAAQHAARDAVWYPGASVVPTEGWRHESWTVEIPGIGELPLVTFLGILLVFALVIGPLNFYILARFKRPNMLLLTIPVASLGCSILIVVFGIMHEGLGVRSASCSHTVLDQRIQRHATVERMSFYAGISPAAGLVPGASTVVLPEDFREPRTFRVDEREGTRRLGGAFLPVRVVEPQLRLATAAGRPRLLVDAAREGQDAHLEVTNGLGVPIESLMLRDASGFYHELAAPIADGEAQVLEPQRGLPGLEEFASPLQTADIIAFSLVPGSFVARVPTNPFRDDLGVSGDESWGDHIIEGILPLDDFKFRSRKASAPDRSEDEPGGGR